MYSFKKNNSGFEKEFLDLAKQWEEETSIMSSITMKSMHPAYQRIIDMGKQIVPLILRKLQKKPDHWFWALNAITGVNPVSPDDEGNIGKMAIAWIEYGKRNGYLNNEL